MAQLLKTAGESSSVIRHFLQNIRQGNLIAKK